MLYFEKRHCLPAQGYVFESLMKYLFIKHIFCQPKVMGLSPQWDEDLQKTLPASPVLFFLSPQWDKDL